jgi:hypothetical protein
MNVLEVIEEAFDRCGMEMRTGYELRSANRSLKLLFADWANRGINYWTVKQLTTPVVQGTATYPLGENVIDVLSIVLRRDGTDYALERMSRDQYIKIPDKTQQGRPNQFYVDRQINPVLKVWQTPDNNTDVLVYDCLTQIASPSNNTVEPEIPFRFQECLVAGLASFLAVKFAPDRIAILQPLYEQAFQRASFEDRDRASFRVAPSVGYR